MLNDRLLVRCIHRSSSLTVKVKLVDLDALRFELIFSKLRQKRNIVWYKKCDS